MKIRTLLSAVLCSVLLASVSFANNINVQNVSLEDQVAAEHYVYIEFDLSWDNSWRTTSVPNNWDAAWVFCKYRLAGGEWQHVYIHDTNHYVPYTAEIAVAPDTTGAFIYRAGNGSGTNNWYNIRLRWDYGNQGINDDAALEVKVFAIEMVYVPEGAYYLGDSTSFGRFYTYNDTKSFYQVSSEDAFYCDNSLNNLWALNQLEEDTVPAIYPKGYQAFYVMKYEISQEQYIDFLNALTRAQQDTRTATDISGTTVTNVFVMANQPTEFYKNGIRCDATLPATGPVNFYADYDEDGIGNETTDGQNVVCNFLAWPDLAAYLDWSGLRPMTELEFEKACRGPNYPVGGEYAWGDTLIYTSAYTLANEGQPNEAISSLPAGVGNCLYSDTRPASDKPVSRCGVFAASSTNHTRMETGATYYGIMEMSGSTWEICVNIRRPGGKSFTGLHGNGMVLPSGDADVDHWPGINGNNDDSQPNGTYQTVGVTGNAGAGSRGGNISMDLDGLAISSRDDASGIIITTRNSIRGGRGVRTAP